MLTRKKLAVTLVSLTVIALIAIAALGVGRAQAAAGDARTGNWSLVGTGLTGSYQGTAQAVTLQTGASTASVWIKGSGTVVIFIHDTATWSTTYGNTFCTATSSWAQCVVNWTASVTGVTMSIEDGGSGGPIYVDDAFIGLTSGANKLTNEGFESGNTAWTVTPPKWAITQATSGPTSTATATSTGGAYDDEFTSGTLAGKWSWVRVDGANWSLTARSGFMRIVAQAGDINGSTNTAKNILLETAPTGDFTVDVKMDGKPASNWAQGGIVVYQDDNNYVKMVRLYSDANVFQFAKEAASTLTSGTATDGISGATSYLRIVKSGTNYSGYYSSNGTSFTQVWSTQSISLSNIKIGFVSMAGTGLNSEFDYVHVTSGGGPTPTNTPVGPTATRTNTPVPPTATRTSTPAGCGSTNIALNHSATASSVEASGLEASMAVDGSTSTRWASTYSDPQWIYVDLGASSNVCRVKLNWEAAYGRNYQIQTSNDASNWTSIYTTTTGDGGIDDLTGLSGTGRYVRMYGTVRATTYGYSLWELEVYSTGGGGPTPTRTNTPVGPTPTATPGGSGLNVPPGWNLVFNDDFNSAPTTSNYYLGLPYAGVDHLNDELECYQAGQISASGGILTLQAKQGSCGNAQTYPSGAITTKATFQHGYFEARIKMPQGKGFWPAFWLTSADGRWPPEWDILEVVSTAGEIYEYPHPVSGGTCSWQSGAAGSDSIYTSGEGAPNVFSQYNVFGLLVTTSEVTWYVNGVTTAHYHVNSAAGSDDHFWVLLNLAVGGNWPGNPDGTTPWPGNMLVDYLKIWQP